MTTYLITIIITYCHVLTLDIYQYRNETYLILSHKVTYQIAEEGYAYCT